MLVDGAQGGHDGHRLGEPPAAPPPRRPQPVGGPRERLRQAGVTPPQVQAAWIKQAEAGPARLGEFPKHAEAMKRNMVTLLNKLAEKFPNLRIAYLSSRYAGYARTELNPEPYAYESAFVVRWLIRDQIGGEPSLNFDPAKGPPKSPVLLWGPYLWADGQKGRKRTACSGNRRTLAATARTPARAAGKSCRLLLRFFQDRPDGQDLVHARLTQIGTDSPVAGGGRTRYIPHVLQRIRGRLFLFPEVFPCHGHPLRQPPAARRPLDSAIWACWLPCSAWGSFATPLTTRWFWASTTSATSVSC